jgi:hypothetical protein
MMWPVWVPAWVAQEEDKQPGRAIIKMEGMGPGPVLGAQRGR